MDSLVAFLATLLVAAILLLVLTQKEAHADILYCADMRAEGTYSDNIASGNMATFKTSKGTKVLFSFNDCQVEFYDEPKSRKK